MKTFKFAALGLVTLAAVACSKELNNDTTSTDVLMEPIVLHAVQDSTKTHIESIGTTSATINWDNGDAISFFSIAQGGNVSLTASNISGASADFSGDIPSGTTDFAAVYPYTSGAVYSLGTITGFSIPTTQTATAGSFANGAALAIATGTKTPGVPEVTGLQFKNLCSVLAFTFPSNIDFANEVIISSKHNETMAGNVTISYADAKITSANSTSVTIKPASGNFKAGETYYITVAPGTYTDGVSFTIKTAGGNTYYRATSKTISAAAGAIYPLGKLSLELPAECFSPKVVVTHNVSGGVLTGSTAVFSMTSSVPDEFDGAIKSVLTSVKVTKGSDTYRTGAGSGKNVSETNLTQSSGKPYIPSGCTYSATIVYTINNGVKDVARQIVKNCDVEWTAPSGFSITAAPTGYTSYSCYAGKDGQSASVTNANNCDNATIYGIGYSYTGGLAAGVKTQADNEKLLTIETTLDGTAASGNATSQSWAAHTIKVTSWKFDGVSGNINSEKSVHVTGLPYNKNNDKAYNYKDDWSWTKNGSWKDDNYLNWYLATVNFKGFYIPANINSTISYRFKNYSGSSFVTYLKCWAGGTLFVNAEDKATSKWYEYSGSNSSITFTPTNNSVKCENSAKSSAASSWVATSQMFYFGAVYR